MPMAQQIKNFVFWFVFLGLSLETAILKTRLASIFDVKNRLLEFSFYPYLSGHIADRPTIRWLGEILIFVHEKIVEGFYALAFWGVSDSLFFSGTPFVSRPDNDILIAGPAIPATTLILFTITCLMPLAFLAQTWLTSLWARLLFLCVVFGALVGWPPFIVTLFFDFMGLFADWPRSYYLFAQRYFVHDLTALLVVLCQFIYLKYRQSPPVFEVILITILSHGSYEYMGMIFGIAYASVALAEHNSMGWKAALLNSGKRLCLTGATVLGMATATYVVYYEYVGEVNSIVDFGGFATKAYIANNLTWIHSIVANLITLMGIAAIAGSVIGGLARLFDRQQPTSEIVPQSDLFILGGMLFGYLITFVIGIFTVPYPAEMGRAFMPLSVLSVLFSCRAIILAGSLKGMAREKNAS